MLSLTKRQQGIILHDALWLAVILTAGAGVALLPLDLVMVLIGGTALILLTFVRPHYGVYALIFAVPFGSLRQVTFSGFNVDVSDICVVLVVSAWLAGMVVRREVVIPHLPFLLPLAAFLTVLVTSWLAALSVSSSLKETAKWVLFAALYLFVGGTFPRTQVRTAVTLILIAGGAQALLGFYQFFGRAGPDGFLWHTPVGLFMRAHGTFAQPNPYGGYLGLVAPLAYGLWLTSFNAAGLRRSIWRWATEATLYAAAAVLLVVAILMTWSRGAMLGFAAAFVVVNVQRSRQAAILFIVVILLVAGLGAFQLLPEAIVQRFLDFLPFLSIPDVSAVEVNPTNFAIIQRLAHWLAAWRMFDTHPWTGVGIGNYAVMYPAYALPAWPDPLGHAHNYYLNVLAETGIVGLAVYLSLWGAILGYVLSVLRRLSGYAAGVTLGVLGVLVHLSVHNLVDNLYVHGMYLHIAVLLGCVVALARETDHGTNTGQRGPAGPTSTPEFDRRANF